MTHFDHNSIRGLVQPGRVHRKVYTDPEIFTLEVERVFGRTWNYVGHQSQVPNPGDYFSTTVANRPVIMVRHSDGRIRVLHNRCAHRGAKVIAGRSGNAKLLRCCYHGWTYHTDGTLHSIPRPSGYAGTPVDAHQSTFGMPALNTECYRGFVFASLTDAAGELEEFLAGAGKSLDNMVDRSPLGKLEVVGGCFRAMLRSNWKIYLENLHDGIHPLTVHQSSIAASKAQERKVAQRNDAAPPLDAVAGVAGVARAVPSAVVVGAGGVFVAVVGAFLTLVDVGAGAGPGVVFVIPVEVSAVAGVAGAVGRT